MTKSDVGVLSFEGIRISGYDEFDVVVRRDGLRHVVRFDSKGSILSSNLPPNWIYREVESFARERFLDWCKSRKLSHAGTDMA